MIMVAVTKARGARWAFRRESDDIQKDVTSGVKPSLSIYKEITVTRSQLSARESATPPHLMMEILSRKPCKLTKPTRVLSSTGSVYAKIVLARAACSNFSLKSRDQINPGD